MYSPIDCRNVQSRNQNVMDQEMLAKSDSELAMKVYIRPWLRLVHCITPGARIILACSHLESPPPGESRSRFEWTQHVQRLAKFVYDKVLYLFACRATVAVLSPLSPSLPPPSSLSLFKLSFSLSLALPPSLHHSSVSLTPQFSLSFSALYPNLSISLAHSHALYLFNPILSIFILVSISILSINQVPLFAHMLLHECAC
jgi:hypothetical protein